jgi:hypothetical protein
LEHAPRLDFVIGGIRQEPLADGMELLLHAVEIGGKRRGHPLRRLQLLLQCLVAPGRIPLVINRRQQTQHRQQRQGNQQKQPPANAARKQAHTPPPPR